MQYWLILNFQVADKIFLYQVGICFEERPVEAVCDEIGL